MSLRFIAPIGGSADGIQLDLHEELLMPTSVQIIADLNSRLESLSELAAKTLDGVEEVMTLNLQMSKALLGDAARIGAARLGCKDVPRTFALEAGLWQSAAETANTCSRQVFGIAAATNAEMIRFAAAQSARAQANFVSAFDGAARTTSAVADEARH